MTDSDTSFDDPISVAAQGPAKVATDGTSADARPISELIEADRYLAGKRASRAGVPGLRIFPIPGGNPQ